MTVFVSGTRPMPPPRPKRHTVATIWSVLVSTVAVDRSSSPRATELSEAMTITFAPMRLMSMLEIGAPAPMAIAQGMPSAPERAVIVTDAPDRPQPRRDVMNGGGMSVTVGRVREDNLFDLRLVVAGHNTIRGAAGGSILNAEIALGAPTAASPEASLVGADAR